MEVMKRKMKLDTSVLCDKPPKRKHPWVESTTTGNTQFTSWKEVHSQKQSNHMKRSLLNIPSILPLRPFTNEKIASTF